MSRLLQALKNLEARAPKAPARSVLTHLADKSSPPSPDRPARSVLANLADKFHSPSPDPPAAHADQSEAARPTPIRPQPLDSPLAYLSAGLPTNLRQSPPTFAPQPQPIVAPVLEIAAGRVPTPLSDSPPALPPPPVAVTPPLAASNIAALRFAEPAPKLPESAFAAAPPAAPPPSAAPRQPTLLERAVRRTLADSVRSEPLRQLAARLKNDLDQVAGRSILITGIGPASETHEVTLHAAAILAEGSDEILVIDGDAASRNLSAQLDFADAFGLADLAKNLEPANDPIQPTSLDRVALLPLGKSRMPDPASVGNRLSSLVQSLEQSYRLVLIDGGRAGKLNAAALAPLCDATYFVVRLGETEASQAESALRDFRAAGARILGCIATS